jgi:formate hydrogenlyase transcriptional activator
LRARKTDIVSLAHHFIEYYSKKYNKGSLTLTNEQTEMMKNYRWPGNVRELKHVIERSVLVSEGDRLELDLSNIPENSASENPFSDFPTLDEIQCRYIQFVLKHTDGKIGGPGNASEILNVNRTTLNSRMRKLGMR